MPPDSLVRVGDSGLLAQYLASEGASVDYCNEVVDGAGRLLYLDRDGSMSAYGPGPATLWPTQDQLLDQQERFLNGS